MWRINIEVGTKNTKWGLSSRRLLTSLLLTSATGCGM